MNLQLHALRYAGQYDRNPWTIHDAHRCVASAFVSSAVVGGPYSVSRLIHNVSRHAADRGARGLCNNRQDLLQYAASEITRAGALSTAGIQALQDALMDTFGVQDGALGAQPSEATEMLSTVATSTRPISPNLTQAAWQLQPGENVLLFNGPHSTMMGRTIVGNYYWFDSGRAPPNVLMGAELPRDWCARLEQHGYRPYLNLAFRT